MSVAWKRLKVYVRVVMIGLVAAAIAAVLIMNRANVVAFWFFGLTDPNHGIKVVWLMVSTAAGTLISWWVFSFGWGLWRDMRDVKRAGKVEQTTRALNERETVLAARERRIDDKVKRAIEHTEESDCLENVTFMLFTRHP